MKSKLTIYYDDEGDYLEMHVGKYRKGHFEDISEGVSQRIDEKTGKVTGLSIVGFKKRLAKGRKMAIPIDFPFLEPR